MKSFLFRSLGIVGFSFVVAFAVNATRTTPLAWAADSDYEIYDDCDETTETAEPIAIAEVLEHPDYYLLVDAREPDAFAAGSAAGAVNLPYDPLFSVGQEEIDELRSQAGDRGLVIIGDPETAKLLADDLFSQGMTFVNYLEEGDEWTKLVVKETE
ncbi:MAG: hypothetical protein HKN20_04700 [Gemmatimonadetes bacterium]|nr:hypothetical protein [Gemmatimonadota bacterium]